MSPKLGTPCLNFERITASLSTFVEWFPLRSNERYCSKRVRLFLIALLREASTLVPYFAKRIRLFLISQLQRSILQLTHLCLFENGRAWVSDPAAARSENVALPTRYSAAHRDPPTLRLQRGRRFALPFLPFGWFAAFGC
jgi:hypothetical protein